MARSTVRVRPSWSIGDLRPGWISVVGAVALPLVAATAGIGGGVGTEVVAVVTVLVFAHHVLTSGPQLTVGRRTVSLQRRRRPVPGGELVTASVTVVAVLPLPDTDGVLSTGGYQGMPVMTAPFLAVSPPAPASLTDPVGLLLGTGRARERRWTLLPVWDPADATALVAAVAAGSPTLEGVAMVADAPAARDEPRTLWTVARELGGPHVAAVVVPLVAATAVWFGVLVARAALLDPILGTAVGMLLIVVARLLVLVAATASIATAVVAVTALLAWDDAGAPIGVGSALRLGSMRSVWVLWQLGPWLIGTAVLMAVTGVTGQRVALAYAATGLAVPGVQALRELLRRTVEEARTDPPPPMTRLSVGTQWVPLAAAVGYHLLLRF